MHDKYRRRGVVFLGFTPHALEPAASFLRRYGISWPNAYGVVGAIGDTAPAIYVVGRDGRIVWSDERARYRHAIDELRRGLDSSIERALARELPATSGH